MCLRSDSETGTQHSVRCFVVISWPALPSGHVHIGTCNDFAGSYVRLAFQALLLPLVSTDHRVSCLVFSGSTVFLVDNLMLCKVKQSLYLAVVNLWNCAIISFSCGSLKRAKASYLSWESFSASDPTDVSKRRLRVADGTMRRERDRWRRLSLVPEIGAEASPGALSLPSRSDTAVIETKGRRLAAYKDRRNGTMDTGPAAPRGNNGIREIPGRPAKTRRIWRSTCGRRGRLKTRGNTTLGRARPNRTCFPFIWYSTFFSPIWKSVWFSPNKKSSERRFYQFSSSFFQFLINFGYE